MGSIIALRRTNTKHWQARLSCSNCLPHCSSKALVPCGPELELTFSSYDSDTQLCEQDSRHELPLEFLPCSSPKPVEKLDKQTDVKSEYKVVEREDKSDCDINADRNTLKSSKYPCPLQAKKCASKSCDKKKDLKAGSKRGSKAGSKAPSYLEARAEAKREDVCCSRSESTKSVKSEFDRDFSVPETDPCFPPAYQEKVQDIVMGNDEKKKKVKPPNKPLKTPKDCKLEKKPSAKNKKDKDKKKKPQEKMKRFEPRKLKNYPTFTQIGGSVNHNCCSCLDAMALYMKEFLRFACSLTTGRPAQDTQFQERVCDMLHILRAACRDCCYLARYVLRLLFVE